MFKKHSISSIITICLLLFLTLNLSASDEIQRIVSLVDYIGGDYKNAVSDGKIINPEEYQEMIDFSSAILDLSKSNNIEKKFVERFQLLKIEIDSKSDVSSVNEITNSLKKDLILAFNLKPYPTKNPDFIAGKLLYENNCSTCHGISGKGDGVLSENLTPNPADFTDNDGKQALSPFKIFNTATFGIEGTAMPSFKTLKDDEKWDVSFYVASLGYQGRIDGNTDDSVKNIDEESIPDDFKDIKKLATLSNEELKTGLHSFSASPDKIVAFLRTNYHRDTTHNKSEDPIKFTISKLEQALNYYRSNDKNGALRESIDAYLEGFEKVEADLSAKDSELVLNIEKKFSNFRSKIKANEELPVIENLYTEINLDLKKADSILKSSTSLSSYVTFLNSFSIIVREALEAVLIIAAIIAFLYASGSKHAVKYIHFGWVAAVMAGFITWFVAANIVKISGAQKEVMEGVTSLLAAGVLFYVSYWLISKIEVNKWKDYLKDKLHTALNKKSIFALMSVSFLAVYREAFETVLFYQALIYQSESTVAQVIWGLLVGLVFISAIMIIVNKLALKIPLKYFFS
ncbi:MAG: FTR1 family protein, partial [Thermodesulfobacteriota bacterium]